MKRNQLTAALVGIAMLAFAGVALGQVRVELGKREYMSNCAVCHGESGKGDGSYFELLKTRIPDITQISKRNEGVFPFDQVYQVIDGRKQLAAHGSREMPIWGRAYSIKEAQYYGDMPYVPGVFVQVRILSLIDYLYSLQVR